MSGFDAADTAPVQYDIAPFLEIWVQMERVRQRGDLAGYRCSVSSVVGGGAKGRRLRGDVLAGGVDTLIERGDGAILLDARTVLRTDDGALINVTVTGIAHGHEEMEARLVGRGGAPGAFNEFSVVLNFSTSDPRYGWTNETVAVGVAERRPDGMLCRISEML